MTVHLVCFLTLLIITTILKELVDSYCYRYQRISELRSSPESSAYAAVGPTSPVRKAARARSTSRGTCQ